ncbi:MAG: hypothetical protein VX278_03785, partial [Myxococcota bacterium]|nr:hypothetical protein [Myxococcota bacterium]
LYKGDGLITETKEWHCADSYVAEKLALCTPAMEIRLLSSFSLNFSPPEGIGVFQEKNVQRIYFEENIHQVRNYRG